MLSKGCQPHTHAFALLCGYSMVVSDTDSFPILQ